MSYLVLLVGFLPNSVVGPADFQNLDALDILVGLVLGFIFMAPPIYILFGRVESASGWFRYLGATLLISFGFLYAFSNIFFASRANAILASMVFISIIIIIAVLLSAQGRGILLGRYWIIASCLMLSSFGVWSVVSGVSMVRQAEALSKDEPFRIVLRDPTRTLDKPNWWQLRGAVFATSADVGFEERSFYYHAVLRTKRGAPVYNWSKRYMRFELVK